MRSEDGLRRHLVVAEEAVRAFELGVAQSCREALAGAFSEAVDQQPKSPGQTGVTEVGLGNFG